MRKTLTYDYDTMVHAADLFGGLQLTGVENFRKAARIADILDSGELSEENEEMVIKKKHGTPPVANKRRRRKNPQISDKAEEGVRNDT